MPSGTGIRVRAGVGQSPDNREKVLEVNPATTGSEEFFLRAF
jgi:hypothetical protein